MKRLGSSESLGDLMSICPSTTDDLNPTTFHHQVYTKRDFQSIFEDDVDDHHLTTTGGDVDSAHSKKRRLSVDQVKALEKNFEVENKLEPERKVKLAQELGLQPRQVAVWFQNRRARWKTKNLERDYGVLKASYDSLKANFEALQQDNQALVKEIKEMKSKLNGDEEVNKAVSDDKNVSSVKDDEVEEEAALVCESNGLQQQLIIEQTPTVLLTSQQDLIGSSARLGMEFIKDGPSDSDSSAILNEVTSPNAAAQPPYSPPGGGVAIHLLNHHQEQSLLLGSFSSPTSASPVFRFNCLASSPSPPPPPPSSTITTYFHNLSSESSTSGAWSQSQHHNVHQLAFVKMEEEEELEEHDFFSDEACNFFSEDQAPSLHHLYCGTDGGSD